jgi:DNA repair protein RadD
MNARLFNEKPCYEKTQFPPLRPSQQTAYAALRDEFKAGKRRIVVNVPTGGGKTLFALYVIWQSLLKGRRVVFVCDRTTLINQTSAAADGVGLTQHGIIQAEHWRRDSSLPFQIASIQTIDKREFWPQADVVVVDECHTMHGCWVEYARNNPATVVIGLTATPFSKGMGKVFDSIINAATAHELTELGTLVPMRVLSCTRPDMAGAAVSKSGEWTDKAAEERGMEIIGDVVAEWLQHGEGRKTICFGASIAHCKELCRQFIDAGVMAAVFTSETTASEREMLVAEFAKPDSSLRVLISVEALAKGFDQPSVSCVIDCRPLRKSLSTFMQMVGRGLRSSPATGKKDCILLDHSGNIVRFGQDFEQVFFNGVESLDMGEKLDRTVRKEPEQYEAKACPSCGHKPFGKRCMACGFEKPAPARESAEAGEMVEIAIGKGKSRKVLADSPAHLWAQLCSYARTYSAPSKQHWRARFLFRDICGHFPPDDWHINTTPDMPVSENVERKIQGLTKHRNIRNKYRRAAV